MGTPFGIATPGHMEDSVEAAFLKKHDGGSISLNLYSNTVAKG